MIAEVVVVDDAEANSGASKDIHGAFMRDTNRSFFDTECVMVERVVANATQPDSCGTIQTAGVSPNGTGQTSVGMRPQGSVNKASNSREYRAR
jgi:hypothetical protein